MKKSALRTRRNFIKQSTIAGSALIFPINSIPKDLFGSKNSVNNGLKVHLFSKHLQFLNYTDMSEAAAEMGFDGLDLTVRPGGHVIPENVAQDLPEAVSAMKKAGLQIQMMTTNITGAENPQNISILKTASQLGFKYYRMGWLKYPGNTPIPDSLEAFTAQFAELAKVNQNLGLLGGYQNHSGKYFGAPVWDLFQVLKELPPKWIGCQYDIRHATVEGANSWELGFDVIKDHINTIVIKDFKWGFENGKWKPVNTPLGNGMVNFEYYFSLLKKYNLNPAVSLHYEYDLGGAEKGNTKLSMDKKEVFKQMKKDLHYLREVWKRAS